MKIKKISPVLVFRYLWIILAAVVILFVLQQGIFLKRTKEYTLDFQQSIGPDITGWYPEARISQMTYLSVMGVDLVGEPVYMKVYSPVDFDIMTVEGSLRTFGPHGDQEIKLGLRQRDGSWDFKEITNNDFSISFDLRNAQIKRNQLELILSVPTMLEGDHIGLPNNWKIILSR